MKYNILFVFFLSVLNINIFSEEIWYKETRFRNKSNEVEYIIYKKYTSTYNENEEETLVHESFYNHYPTQDTEPDSVDGIRVHFEHEAETLISKGNYVYQEITRHISNTNVSLEIIKAEIENDSFTFYRNESGRYNLYKREISNSKKSFFPLSAKIPLLEGMEDIGTTSEVNIINVSTGSIIPLKLEILPKSLIPGFKSQKEFFVLRAGIIKGPTEIYEDIYYDNNGYILYKKRNDNGNITQRIGKPQLNIVAYDAPEITEIDPFISNHSDSDKYFFTYPRSWEKVEKIVPFDAVYRSQTGTLAGVIVFDKKISDLKSLTLNTFDKLNGNRGSKETRFGKIEVERTKNIQLRGKDYAQTIIKTIDNNGIVKYYLILVTIYRGNAFAIVAFGEKEEYQQSWPMWFNFAHSFYPKDSKD